MYLNFVFNLHPLRQTPPKAKNLGWTPSFHDDKNVQEYFLFLFQHNREKNARTIDDGGLISSLISEHKTNRAPLILPER